MSDKKFSRPVRRALLSVSDKTGLVDFATELHKTFGVELIATGGTKTEIAKAGLPVTDVSELTGFPEILDGRVKTLHPAVFAGLLARRDKPEHLKTLGDHKLREIDLVVCNLYPFEETVAKPDVTEAQAIETIDIGGPCMVRAAAKNFHAVAVVTEPLLYNEVLLALKNGDGTLDLDYRRELATAAFQRIADYDVQIAEYFLEQLPGDDDEEPQDITGWVEEFDPPFNLRQTLRYGENPHQEAAFYVEPGLERPCVSTAEQLHGKELSYNNILDLDSALNLVREFAQPAAVVVKHNNPCGAATSVTLEKAFLAAWDGDPLSAFGGILAFNRKVNLSVAKAMTDGDRFLECVIAPDFDEDALQLLTGWKKNVRLLRTGEFDTLIETESSLDYRRVDGGLLVQTRDVGKDDPSTWKVVTQRTPSDAERAALHFAWLACKHVKSNAITLAQGTTLVGVGAGQMSRVMSVEIAIRKAGDKAKGSVLASDAFFPFADNVALAVAAGVTAIVQPGGSVKDADSIAACDAAGIAMLFTGVRHFRH